MLLHTKIIGVIALVNAAIAYSPTGNYAPGAIQCPNTTTASNSTNFVRMASGLSQSEQEWLQKRHEHTDEALKDFLERADISDFDVDDFFDSLNSSINIGLAFSGGGYRAMLNGAGQISALDNRTDGANDHGLGGLLQATTYLAGLSGGNWLTGTLALNNWTSVQELLNQSSIWSLESPIISQGTVGLYSILLQFEKWYDSVEEKEDAGFDVSLTDIWGRALSYVFFGSNKNGDEGLTYSTIRSADLFKNGEMPFPISLADGRTPGTLIINENSTVFEFNPFEMGSWDPSLYAFTDLKYLGTNVSNGEPVNKSQCIAGFDNAGFVLGTSSSIFNSFSSYLDSFGISGFLKELLEDFFEVLSNDDADIALYSPNPFYNTSYAAVDSIVTNDSLYLCDGGDDGQGIPFAPLIQPERQVDVIFAFDNNDNTEDSFPDGSSMVATYERQFSVQGNGTSFPYVPNTDTFLQNNLTSKPTFFGCNASNLTDLSSIPPLVVYIPNIAYSFWSNTSTMLLSYSDEERDAMIQNGFEVSTRYNLTIDEDWPKCVGCAIIQREMERTNQTISDDCQECFDNYCWNGEYVNTLDLAWSNATSTNETYSFNSTTPNNITAPDTGVLIF